MMPVDDFREKYLIKKTQIVVLDKNGLILQSDNHLLDLPLKVLTTSIHPFFETIQVLLNQAKDAISFNCVHINYKTKKGIFDLILKSEIQQNYLIIYDFTDHYTSFQNIAQDRNQSLLNFYYEKLKTEHLSNEKAFKQRFLSQFSKDIKTPLETVMALQDVLYQSNLTSHQKSITLEVKDYLQNIYQKTEGIYDLIKIEQGLIPVNIEPFYLKKKIKQLEKKYLKLSAKKNVAFDIFFEDRLPDFLEGDSQKLIQILESLLNNAFKFTNNGQVQLFIKKAYKRANQIGLTFEITDTGQSLNNHKLIINIENNLQINDEYLGLGFSLVKKLLIPMKANINYKPTNSGGNVFSITIPFQFNLFEEPMKELVYKPITLKKRLSILCLDDQEINHLVILKMLIAHGQISIDTATNYKEALRLLENNTYDILLIHADMPQFDPQSFYDFVKNKWKRKMPKFIWLSQILSTNNKNAYKHVLKRPFVAEELYQKIYQTLKLV